MGSGNSEGTRFLTTTIGVSGMTCAHCSARVEKALRNQPGVKSVQVDLNAGNATVTYDSPASLATLHAALTKSGYPPIIPTDSR